MARSSSLNHVRFHSLFATALIFIYSSGSMAQPSDGQPSDAISALNKKGFRITTVGEKTSLSLIPGYKFPASEPEWPDDDYANCINSTAKLLETSAATIIEGTDRVLAFLNCPASNDDNATSVVALFERKNTDTPICFNRIRLLDKKDYHFWGGVRLVNAKKQADGGIFVAVGLSGADAGDFWTSSAFLYIDRRCSITLLTKLYAAGHMDDTECDGYSLSHKFVSDFEVKVDRTQVTCPSNTQNQPLSSKRILEKTLNLKTLLQNDKFREIQP